MKFPRKIGDRVLIRIWRRPGRARFSYSNDVNCLNFTLDRQLFKNADKIEVERILRAQIGESERDLGG